MVGLGGSLPPRAVSAVVSPVVTEFSSVVTAVASFAAADGSDSVDVSTAVSSVRGAKARRTAGISVDLECRTALETPVSEGNSSAPL